jgi:hypothetical protein
MIQLTALPSPSGSSFTNNTNHTTYSVNSPTTQIKHHTQLLHKQHKSHTTLSYFTNNTNHTPHSVTSPTTQITHRTQLLHKQHNHTPHSVTSPTTQITHHTHLLHQQHKSHNILSYFTNLIWSEKSNKY